MNDMKKLTCLLALFGLVAFAGADEINLKIEGMSCEVGCVKKVNNVLSKNSGVTAKKVELGKAKITFDAKKTSKSAIVKAIEKAGFTVAKK